MSRRNESAMPSIRKYLEVVITREPCPRHGALLGLPCWEFPNASGIKVTAICNKRAEKAGFFSKISNEALQIQNPQRKARQEYVARMVKSKVTSKQPRKI